MRAEVTSPNCSIFKQSSDWRHVKYCTICALMSLNRERGREGGVLVGRCLSLSIIHDTMPYDAIQ